MDFTKMEMPKRKAYLKLDDQEVGVTFNVEDVTVEQSKFGEQALIYVGGGQVLALKSFYLDFIKELIKDKEFKKVIDSEDLAITIVNEVGYNEIRFFEVD